VLRQFATDNHAVDDGEGSVADGGGMNIKTDEEYEEILLRVWELMNAESGSADEKELELLSAMVEKYEDEHFPIEDQIANKIARMNWND